MSKKILVVDDDPRLRRLVVITLGTAYQVLEAGNGEEALTVAGQHLPDLILLDVRMPKMDGFEVCRRLKGSFPTSQIKVVMLTGLNSDEDFAAGQQAGADAYFVKPFSPRSLLDKLDQMLD